MLTNMAGFTDKIFKPITGVVSVMLCSLIFPACTTPPKSLKTLLDINSHKPEIICKQALEVIDNNDYSKEFFEKVFEKVVASLKENRKKGNDDIIWDNFVMPLKRGGKVPPDLAVRVWNYYFSNEFVSLPDENGLENYCRELPDIKESLIKEYTPKKRGFEICKKGSVDKLFAKAQYVYNTMLALCMSPE